jgi:hypothetical protein
MEFRCVVQNSQRLTLVAVAELYDRHGAAVPVLFLCRLTKACVLLLFSNFEKSDTIRYPEGFHFGSFSIRGKQSVLRVSD